MSLAQIAHLDGITVCKHTNGELGITAAGYHHVMMALPNAALGYQQTATMIAEDMIKESLSISTGPRWDAIEAPGLGIAVDRDRVSRFQEAYLRDGAYLPFTSSS